MNSKMSWFAYRAIGLRGRNGFVEILKDGLYSNYPHIRGTSALALARLGETLMLRQAFEEAQNASEKVFTSLAMLAASIVEYQEIEPELRRDLADSRSFDFAFEAQMDILKFLRIMWIKLCLGVS